MFLLNMHVKLEAWNIKMAEMHRILNHLTGNPCGSEDMKLHSPVIGR
jgi:hypothetical protein